MVTPACQKTDQHKWITKTKVGGQGSKKGDVGQRGFTENEGGDKRTGHV